MSSPVHFECSTTIQPSENRNFITALRCGLLGGLAVSWVLYSKNRNLLKGIGEGSPLPIIFTGMLGVAIVEGIGLAYEVAKRILGERSKFNSEEMEALSGLEKLRCRAWKVISWLEERVEIVDKIYSRIFRVRTEKEILDKEIPRREFTFMEIVRIAFKEQAEETMNEEYPTKGYTALLCNFALGVTDKFNKLSHKIQKERIEEQKEKMFRDILEIWAGLEIEKDYPATPTRRRPNPSSASQTGKAIQHKVKAICTDSKNSVQATRKDSREVKNATA